jgi:hypothetical protein
MPKAICLKLTMQTVRCALPLAALKTGSNKAVRIPMIAITTSSSTNVNPLNVVLTDINRHTAISTTKAEPSAIGDAASHRHYRLIQRAAAEWLRRIDTPLQALWVF